MLAQETLTAGSIATRLAAVLGLVLLNGFFVAAEFALVGARRSRLTQLAEEGHRGAKHALKALGRLDHYISGTQVGITIASLALGWIGEPAVAVLVDRLLALVGIQVPPGAAHTAAAENKNMEMHFMRNVGPKSLDLESSIIASFPALPHDAAASHICAQTARLPLRNP